MNFELANKVEIVNPYANIDAMYGPYSNLPEALSAIPIELRIIGRTVGIITDTHIDEYWWKNGVKDSDLVLKAAKIDSNYVHDQAQPSSIWTINHPLNKKVSVTITDTAGTVVEGQVTINDGNKVVIEFNFPFSGEAILN